MRNGIIPMFALTGRPERADIAREIDAFFSVGIEEVMIYPRSGCLIPYMSEQWFQMVKEVISLCAERGMKIWLYDEFNWPSGSCGNQVQKESSAFWSKKLIWQDGAVQIVSDSRFPDLLYPESVKTFIRLTHEKYKARFQDAFGTVIRGIFTDEPCFGYIAENTHEIVFYEGMERDYGALTGRDLFADTALYYQNEAPAGYMKAVYQLLGERMGTCYIGALAAWCEQNGLLLTGHLLDDHAVSRGIRSNGDTLRVLEKIHIPGIDDIQTTVRGGMLTTYAHIEAVKRRTGRGTMIELFALGPCNMGFSRKKRSLYLAAAFGISRYFLAVAHLDAKGNYHKLRNYFNAECSMTPDYEATKLLCAEAERAAEYAGKQSKTDVYVQYPREKMLEYMNCGAWEKVDKTELVLQNLLMDLLNNQVSFAFTEEADAQNLLCVRADGVYDKAGNRVPSVPKWCGAHVRRSVSVYENGVLAKGVFVKAFADKSFMVIDCTEEESMPRRVDIRAFGKKKSVVLYPQEVLLTEDFEKDFRKEEIQAEFSVQYETGVCRAYLWEPFHFVVKKPVEVQFLVRCYPKESRVYLDGEKIEADLPCSKIGAGFDGLYKTSAPQVLEAGEHVLESLDLSSEERLYLPVCVLVGDFQSRGNVLAAKPKMGKQAYFYGKCVFSTEIFVPETAAYICFETRNLLTKVYVNNEILGMAAESLAKVSIPEHLRGKATELRLEQYSGLAPLFGETESEYCIRQNQTPDWNIGFGVKQAPGGIGRIWFLE